MPNIRRPNVPPMPARPVSPMPRITGGGKTPYPPNVDYRPVNKMPARPGRLPRSNAPGDGIAATQPPPVEEGYETGPVPVISTGGGKARYPEPPPVPIMDPLPMPTRPQEPPIREVGPGVTKPGDGWDYRKGGKVKKMASGGMTSKASSASSRGDGIAKRGKTKGKIY